MQTKKYISVAVGLILAFSSFATAFAETVSIDVTPEPTAFYTAEADTDRQTQEQIITDSNEPLATEQPSAMPETTVQPDETLPEASIIPTESQLPDPTAETTAAAIETPTPAITDTAEPQPQPVRSADIHVTIPKNPQYGDTVTLQATLNGYEGVAVSLQWQYSRDQEHWTDAHGNGANGTDYSFQINDDTVCTYWRLAVTTA